MKRVIIALALALVLMLALGTPVMAGHINKGEGHGGGERGATADIEIFNFYFSPNPFLVTVSLSGGDVSVTWVNREGNHDVTNHELGINSPNLKKGETFSLNVSQLVRNLGLGTGTHSIGYHCHNHEAKDMTGTLVITVVP